MPRFNFGKFFGNTVSTAAGTAAGASTAAVLAPLLQEEVNLAWGAFPNRPVSPGTLASGVSQGQVDPDAAKAEARLSGFSPHAFDTMVNIANTGPPLAQALEAFRRSFLTPKDFETAINRAGIEKQWWDAMTKLADALLDPADLARGIHKGLIPDPGLLAVPAPSGEGKIPAYPVYPIDALKSAAGYGYSKDELGVLVGLQGNPMGAHEAAQAQFRGVLEPVDYDRAIAEGNTRNEWGDAIREQSRQIPTSHEFIENALRGYTTLDQALAGAAKHGMSPEDATLVYQNAGRPMAVHQITTGLARGGVFKPEPGEIRDPYMASIVEGSVKPAYYDLAMANRYTLPGYFVIKAMLTSHALTQPEAAQLFKESGWPPDLADKAAAALAPSSSTTPSTWVTKSRGYVFTKVHKEYQDTAEYDAYAREAMALLLIPPADQDTILELFKFEEKPSPRPDATTISPATAPVGATVSVNVSGFAANHPLTVTVGGLAAQITSGATTDGNGAARVAFVVPQVGKGFQPVTISDGTRSSAPDNAFTVV